MSPGWQLDRIQRIFNYSWGSNPKFSTWSGTSRSFAWSGMNLTAPWSKVWPWNISQILIKFLTKGRPEKWNQQLKPSNVSWWTPSQLRKEKTQEGEYLTSSSHQIAPTPYGEPWANSWEYRITGPRQLNYTSRK